MAEMNLGPNGGLVYAMEYLVENIDWLQASASVAITDTSRAMFSMPILES
jgi:hypothetical protein